MTFASDGQGRRRDSRAHEARRRKASGLGSLEVLEGRQLLSSGQGTAMSHGPDVADVARGDRGPGNDNGPQGPKQEVIEDGKVVKAPNFYEVYLGSLPAGATPRQDLNVREASAKLDSHGRLLLSGTMNARIDLTRDSVFVWGLDRSGQLGPARAPFPGRPNIRFDAVVVVQVKAGVISGSVNDLVTRSNSSTLPADAIKIDGRKVEVTVADAAHALPSTGLPLAQYRFNLWPRVALGAPSTVVSFAPEDGMASIGT